VRLELPVQALHGAHHIAGTAADLFDRDVPRRRLLGADTERQADLNGRLRPFVGGFDDFLEDAAGEDRADGCETRRLGTQTTL
jgi:hypothetical protein